MLGGGTRLSVGAVLSIVIEKLTVSKASRGGIVYGKLGTRAMGVISGEKLGDGAIEAVYSVFCTTGSGVVEGVVVVCRCTWFSVRTRGSLRGRAASL